MAPIYVPICTLDPHESVVQTASRSIQPFLHSSPELPFAVVSRVGPSDTALDSVHIGATWQIRLNNCAWRLSGFATGEGVTACYQISVGRLVFKFNAFLPVVRKPSCLSPVLNDELHLHDFLKIFHLDKLLKSINTHITEIELSMIVQRNSHSKVSTEF